MDSRRGHGFGWTTPCPADGLAVSLRHVDALWSSYFPAPDGYVLARRVLPDGLRLSATRGDFHAEVEVAGGQRRGAPKLRLCGTAGSRRVAATERAASFAVERLRLVGSGLGIAFVGLICSQLLVTPMMFMVDALFVLGGLLMVVMLMVLVITGAGLGGWVGEQLVAGRWASTLAALEQDGALHADLQRWRALVRSLGQHRDALAGGLRGLPFRCEFVAEPDPEPAHIA